MRGVNEPLRGVWSTRHGDGSGGRTRRHLLRLYGGSGRASATPAGGRARRRSRCASARSSSRTRRGRTSRRRLDVLRRRGLLSFRALDGLPASRLAPLIRSSGTYRVKARRLRRLPRLPRREYGGRVEAHAGREPRRLRRQLLAVPRHRPRDRRLDRALRRRAAALRRRRLHAPRLRAPGPPARRRERTTRSSASSWTACPRDAALYNDYHAQIVRLAKDVLPPAAPVRRVPARGSVPRRARDRDVRPRDLGSFPC